MTKIQSNATGIDSAGAQKFAYSSNDAGLTIHVARTLEEVEEIRGIWSAWETHRDNNIDICVESVWSAAEVIRPHVIVISRHGRTEAMLVGRLEHVQMTSRIGYLKFPGIRIRQLTFAKGGILGNASAENSEEIIKAIQNALSEGEVDVAMLHQVRTDTDLYAKALSLSGFATRDHRAKPVQRNSMKLTPSVDQVYKGMSSGLRADVRRKKRKILEEFGDRAQIRCFRDSADLDHVINQLEEIAAKTYQRGLGAGFKDTNLMRERLQLYARKGWLRIYLFTVDERPIAFWLGTVLNGSFCSDYLGFDPGFGKYSPGTFLIATMIDDFCREGVTEIDFGIGEGRYKDRFGNHRVTESSVFIFRSSFKGIMLNAIQSGTSFIDASMRKLLDSTRLLPTFKRLWRKKLSADDAEAPTQ